MLNRLDVCQSPQFIHNIMVSHRFETAKEKKGSTQYTDCFVTVRWINGHISVKIYTYNPNFKSLNYWEKNNRTLTLGRKEKGNEFNMSEDSICFIGCGSRKTFL